MRTTFLTCIISLFTLTSGLSQTSVQFLPKPEKEIVNQNEEDRGFRYLESSFGKRGRRVNLIKFTGCLVNCVCAWQQSFKNGVLYTYNKCSEAGVTITISFPNTTVEEVVNLVNQLFETPQNKWNAEQNKYNPPDGEAGCNYEIRSKNGTAMLEYRCGC